MVSRDDAEFDRAADDFGDVTDAVLDADPYADLPLDDLSDANLPPADDEAIPADEDAEAPAKGQQGITAPAELRESNPSLYSRALDAGLLRADTNPAALLPETIRDDGSDISLEEHLRQTPLGTLPEPDASDVDVSTALVALFGENRVRFYQPGDTTAGGSWQVYMAGGWQTVSEEWMEALVVNLVHPVKVYRPARSAQPRKSIKKVRSYTESTDSGLRKPPMPEPPTAAYTPPAVPQRLRPVTLSKLTVERIHRYQDHGLIDFDPATKRVVIKGTEIDVPGVYRPATDWTGRFNTAANLLKALRGRLTDRRELDAPASPSDWALNVGGTLVHISRDALVGADGELRIETEPVRRHHLVSKSTHSKWDTALLAKTPEERCPNWVAFMEQANSKRDEAGVWNTRPEHEAVLQKLAGTLLVPSPIGHRAAVFYGDHGNNGKSITADTLIHVLGGYGASVDTQYISKGANEPHPTGLMRLIGARGAVMHEMQPEEWHPTRTKRFITDVKMSARRMGQDAADYTRTHTLMVTANNLPSVTGDSGFWKRLVLVPFEARWYAPDDDNDLRAISIAPADSDIEQRILAEADGILLWMLEGLYLYYTEGLDLPEAMHRLKRTARGEGSTWGLFVEDHIEWTDDPADYLNDEDIWLVWKDYVDEVLQGKFERPNKPVRVKDEFVHAIPQAWRRGRNTRPGVPKSERNGFGGVRWTVEGLKRAKAVGAVDATVTHPDDPQPASATVTPLFGGGVK